MSHFSFVFCLICLPSANAFHPRVCGLQPLQPSGLQQPPTGRELRRLQQGNELMEGFLKRKDRRGDVCRLNGEGIKKLSWAKYFLIIWVLDEMGVIVFTLYIYSSHSLFFKQSPSFLQSRSCSWAQCMTQTVLFG